MKTKLILTAMAILVVTAGFAQKRTGLNAKLTEKDQVLVDFTAEQAVPFDLTLTDGEGKVMYYNKPKEQTTGLRKVFDFSEVPDGRFQVSVSYGNCTFSRNLYVSSDQIIVGNEVRTMAPWFSYENDRLVVSCMNPSMKNVYLTFYRNGEYVTSNRLGKDLAIQKCFDLSRLEEGNYEVVLSGRTGEYNYMLEK